MIGIELIRRRHVVFRAKKLFERAQANGWQVSLREVMRTLNITGPQTPHNHDFPLIQEAAEYIGMRYIPMPIPAFCPEGCNDAKRN